jgi:inorganic pyrophosphatase
MDCVAFIEISKGSNIKYEYDKNFNCLVLDRILHNSNVFPYNYGYVPNTLSEDGDPLDIIVLCDYPIIPGTRVLCKIIGGIHTEDESGGDHKILAVLIDKADPKSKFFNNIADMNQHDLQSIQYFLKHYKDGETDKYITIGETYGRDRAIHVLNHSYTKFDELSSTI